MALERLLGTANLATITQQDSVGSGQQLGWDWFTDATGKSIVKGWVRMIPAGSFATGTYWQVWERDMVDSSLSDLKFEVSLGGITGASGAEIEVPAFDPYPVGQNVRHFTTIYHPSGQSGNYWYKDGFGQPDHGTLFGFCIYNNGQPRTVPPIFEGFTNGGFGVDVGIDDTPVAPTHNKGAEFLSFF